MLARVGAGYGVLRAEWRLTRRLSGASRPKAGVRHTEMVARQPTFAACGKLGWPGRDSVAVILESIALGLAAVLSLVATKMLIHSDFESRFQKSAQMILIWVLPFVGAILVIAVLSQSNSRLTHPRNSSDGGDTWMLGMGPESHRESGHHSHSGDGGHGGHGGDGGHGVP
jgi:hypothetical protein